MVKTFYKLALTLSLVSLVSHAESPAPSFGFQTECSKNEIFQGEQVTCSFVIISSDEIVEVEVAKFPEFRGFWSDNLALRQGPIPLMGGIWGENIRKGVVGTYTLIPMLDRPDPTVVPMKIVVRRPMSSMEVDLTVTSEPIALTVKPLPPLPPDFDPRYFKGAVGHFSLYPENREILFQKDEPVVVRLALQGEGNFQEINTIDIPFPENVEVLGRRAFSQGIGQYSSKSFETTLAVHSTDGFTLPPTPFFYFNPTTARYETLSIPELTFRNVPVSIKTADAENEPLVFGEPQTHWTTRRPLPSNAMFWLFHIVCAIATLGAVARRQLEQAASRKRLSPAFQRKIRFDIARQAAQMGNIEMFLRISDELAWEILKETAAAGPGMTRGQVLARAEGKVDSALLTRIRLLFSTFEGFAYSPAKTAPGSLEALISALEFLLASPRTRKKAA